MKFFFGSNCTVNYIIAEIVISTVFVAYNCMQYEFSNTKIHLRNCSLIILINSLNAEANINFQLDAYWVIIGYFYFYNYSWPIRGHSSYKKKNVLSHVKKKKKCDKKLDILVQKIDFS